MVFRVSRILALPNNPIHKGMRHGGDPAESLQEIQGQTFPAQDRSSRALDMHDPGAGIHRVTIRSETIHLEHVIHPGEYGHRHRQPGQYHGFPRDNPPLIQALRIHDELACHIACLTQVFLQGQVDQSHHIGMLCNTAKINFIPFSQGLPFPFAVRGLGRFLF